MYSVYFIQEERRPGRKGDRPVKIGFSKDPQERLKSLQTGHPHKLKVSLSLLFECERDARVMEGTMHRLAKAKHQALTGEWFIIRGDWKRFISQCQKIFDGNKKAHGVSI